MPATLAGHEIEMYAMPAIHHGFAVNIDMALSVCLSCVRGHLSTADRNRVLRCMQGMGLPLTHPVVTEELLVASLAARRKASMGLKLPLPVAIGRCDIFEDVTSEEVQQAWAQLKAWANAP